MRRFWRYLEAIASFEHAGLLPLYGKLEAALQDISRLDSRVRMPTDRHTRLDGRFH
jgi:hypothetical protein